MSTSRIAVIDLGTNTFHLLIVETDGKSSTHLHSEKIPVRIGKGGINQGVITEEAYQRAVDTLLSFKSTTTKFGVSAIYATATSAFRNAKNGLELAERIQKETGIKVSIISGNKEADLIYYGVREALDLGTEKSLIVDIGGGSVEFILANSTTIFWKQSFEIGGQRLLELFQKSDPIHPSEINALTAYLSEQLQPLSKALSEHPTQTLVGSSGSFDTLSEMDLRRKGGSGPIESKKEYSLPLADFTFFYDALIHKNRAERMQLEGMIELRVDMIVVAVVLIKHLLDAYSLTNLRVSTYALKEGVVSQLLKGQSVED